MGTGRTRMAGACCLFLAAAIWGGIYVVSKVILGFVPLMTLFQSRNPKADC